MLKLKRKDILDDIDLPTFLARDDVALFLGSHADYYKTLWLKDFEKKNRDLKKTFSALHWNWLAFFLLPAWFTYHKMWGGFWAVVGFFAALFMVEAYFNYEFLAVGPMAVVIYITLTSKSFYLLHLIRFFEKNKDMPYLDRLDLIEIKGGTSLKWAIIGGAGYFVLLILSLSLAHALFGHPVFEKG